MFRLPLRLCALAACFAVASSSWSAAQEGPGPLRVTVRNEALHSIDARLFGHFLERAQDEPGPEAAVDSGTGRLDPLVVDFLESMEIPIVRFPGGGAVEYGRPWTHLIDGAFGRQARERPDDARFGLDAFLSLSEELDTEPLLVVALSRPLREWHQESWAQSIENAAAMVAYCNARVDADLPENLLRWARLRAANGRSEPWNVPYWQIGNESFWAFAGALTKQGESAETIADLYVEQVIAHLEAMRAVDPEIEIFVEIQLEQNDVPIAVAERLHDRLGDRIDYVTFHSYHPWGIQIVEREGEPFDAQALSQEDFYRAAVSAPGTDPASGQAVIDTRSIELARELGYPVGVTEWNWNGWWDIEGVSSRSLPSDPFAYGLGAAAYLHAFMRQGDVIRVANQSMLVGSNWAISGIRVPKPGDAAQPFMTSTAMAVSLYSRHHGDRFLDTRLEGNTYFAQPYRLQNIRPMERVADLDVVSTRDADTLYVHAINRDPAQARLLLISLEDFLPEVPILAQIYTMREKLPSPASQLDVAEIQSLSLGALVQLERIPVLLPAKSVNVIEVKLGVPTTAP
ncbi:MAG: hypothetical protein ACFB20_06050 [Opitutales bacterium]